MSVLEWLCDRSATCERLRNDCSLLERQVVCLTDDLEASREACVALAQGFQEQEQLGEDLLAVMQSVMAERDGCMRELWLERRRNDELRDRIRLTDANVKRTVDLQMRQEKGLRAWIERLLQDIEYQKQLRIEAQVELETLRRKEGAHA